MLELKLNKDIERFRAEFLLWLRSNPPPAQNPRASLDEFVKVSGAWQNTLAKARFVGVHFPEKFGGRGLTLVEEAVIQEELAKARAPQLAGLFGLTMVGPVLLKHGTPEQQARYVPKILSAEELWCQGFSEPEAGSDLASVKTSGVQRDSGWRITGQKIWTSFAQYAKWCFVLVRTDPGAQKHKGLSYLFVNMKSPGIAARPLKQISGDSEFNEVFFEDTPAEEMIGVPGQGWEIAISTLMYERVVLTFARHLQSEEALSEIADVLDRRDETKLATFGALVAKSMAVRALALSHLSRYDAKHPPGPEGSLDKLAWSETFQEICRFGLEVLGERAVLVAGPAAYRDGTFQHRYLYSRGRTIAAGTSEIQRGIIAERLLGLK